MRLLITGAAGFLGSHLADRFLREGHGVIGMDNLITGARENVAHLQGNRRFQFVLHDVSRFIQVDGPLDGVLHFASPASPIDYLELPIQTLKGDPSAPTTRSGSPRPRVPASSWRLPRMCTGTRRCTPSRRVIGAT